MVFTGNEIATPAFGGLAMTTSPLSLRGAKRLRLFCHCEPDRESGQAWQSLYFKKICFANFFPLKNEIATPPLREARNDKGEDCHGLSFGEPSQ